MCSILPISILNILDEILDLFMSMKNIQRSIHFRAFIFIQKFMQWEYEENLYWKLRWCPQRSICDNQGCTKTSFRCHDQTLGLWNIFELKHGCAFLIKLFWSDQATFFILVWSKYHYKALVNSNLIFSVYLLVIQICIMSNNFLIFE